MAVATTPFATNNGLQITFTDYAFNGSTPGADGIVLFLSDASQPLPAAYGSAGGSLGYANSTTTPGIANAYLGIGLDEYGNFSSPTEGRNGGPGQVPETVAVRGSAQAAYPYLGGATNSSGQAASLPFNFDQPAAATRPANAVTMQVTISPAARLTVMFDRHDGNGFVQYYSQAIVGVNGQGALPAQVYVGLTASTGGLYTRQQISGFAVSTAPSTLPASFTPKQIPNLQAWFDPSNASAVTQASGYVSNLADLSGANNGVGQAATASAPTYVAGGINNLGSLAFGGKAYLYGANGSFSANLFNESTVFAVTSPTPSTVAQTVLWSGAYAANPHWSLQLLKQGANFDFNSNGAGRRSPTVVPDGPAMWTAAGSISKKSQFIRKDGALLSSSTTSGVSATGNYPLSLGATYTSSASSANYTGQLGEVLAFNRLLSTSETAQVEGYLACKWGLQSRLPANHPYRAICPQGGTPAPIPIPSPTGAALQDPLQLRSSNGQLVLNVAASQNASTGNPQLTYNASATPPTLRLLPGDTLIVNLTNNLPTPQSGAGYVNDTNLHFHGLHVSPNAPGDDSIDMLALPGQSLHYQIVIPANHPSGLYWYHSHAHGEAERQNLSGMSGALIVDGISQYAPVANIAERIIIVRDAVPAGGVLPAADRRQLSAMGWAMTHGSHMHTGRMRSTAAAMNTIVRGRSTSVTRNPYVLVDPTYRHFQRSLATATTHCTGAETASKVWTVNGQTMPSIGIRPGEKQFWRLVNAGSDSYLDAQVDNTTMQIVAIDGVPLASIGNAQPTVSHVVVPPASRVEFILRGPAAGTGTSYLRTNCFDAGSSGPAMPAATLASINGTSSLTDLAVRRDRVTQRMALRPRHARSAASLRALAVTGPNQTITYSDQNTINGTAYDPAAPPMFYAQSGTTALWTIVNNASQVHTFHIHQIHFVVQSVTGGTASDASNVGQEMDNVNVPAASSNGPGSVTLKMDFTDPSIVGTFLLHCHILSHEDAGMMAQVRVGTAPPMTVSPTQVNFAAPNSASQNVTVSGGSPAYSVNGCTNVANATVGGTGGNVVTIAPVGGGSCTLTVSDSSGLVSSIAVTVAGTASPVTISPNQLSFASATASAQSASLSGGTAPYTASGCTGIATASITANALTVTPQASGSCTLTISDSANNANSVAVQVNSAAGGNLLDNLTFHQNNARTGWYQNETLLNVTNVASTSFTRLGTLQAPSGLPVFGKVYAQPLYASKETLGDGTTHNLVLIATSTDQVYAYDDKTLGVVWHRSFTSPPNVTQQSYSDTGCGDINPDVGITGTPVVDRNLDRMFVVVPTDESDGPHLRMHAISLKTGADAVAPIEVSGNVALSGGGTASTSAKFNNQRGALLEANGNIYVALAGHCDFGSATTHGWLLAYNASSLAPSGNIINTTDGTSNFYLGSLWMSGYGPASDSQGNVYFATGNGPYDAVKNFGMSVLRVPGNLDITKSSSFTPYAEAGDNNADADLGAGGVMLLPDGLSGTYPTLLIQGGKCGVGSASGGTVGCEKYILNRANLGGQQAGDVGAVWHADTAGGMFGGPAYFQDSAGGSHIVYGGGNPLNTYNLNLSPVSLSIQSSANVGCLECRNSGSQPIVSSNGIQAGTAVVWALKTPAGGNAGNLTLYAFDALNMSHTLYAGIAGTWTIGAGASYIGGAMISPLEANGRVYVPADGTVAVFGLTGTTPAAIPRLPLRRGSL